MIAKTEINSRKQVYGRIVLKFIRADGTVRKVRKYDAHSLVYTFWKCFFSKLKANNVSLTDINGGANTFFYGDPLSCLGAVGSPMGVIVGSGNTALSVTQTQLVSMINDGSGAGQLEYTANIVAPDTNNRKATISRNFENFSGGTVTVNEIGLTMDDSVGRTGGPYLIARDVLPASEDVLDTETLSVGYEIFFTHGVKNYQAIFQQMNGAADFTFTETNGNTFNEDFLDFDTEAPANNNSYGILVGNGDTPVDFNDFNLDSKISAGSNPGQLNSTPVTFSPETVDDGAGTVSFDIKRGFLNNSGGDITVREMGLFAAAFFGSNELIMLDRVVLPAPITIRAGEQRLAKWLFRYSI